MTEAFAKVSFVNNNTGARLDGEFVADTGPTWMMKPYGKPVQVLQKSEWTSVPPKTQYPYGDFGDIFSQFTGR